MADSRKFATVPINPDGSIKVKIVKDGPVDINIEAINGQSLYFADPIKVKMDN